MNPGNLMGSLSEEKQTFAPFLVFWLSYINVLASNAENSVDRV